MSAETKYSYQKRIRQLEDLQFELTEKLSAYRQTVLEIFDGMTEVESNGINKNWLLKKLRRCLK